MGSLKTDNSKHIRQELRNNREKYQPSSPWFRFVLEVLGRLALGNHDLRIGGAENLLAGARLAYEDKKGVLFGTSHRNDMDPPMTTRIIAKATDVAVAAMSSNFDDFNKIGYTIAGLDRFMSIPYGDAEKTESGIFRSPTIFRADSYLPYIEAIDDGRSVVIATQRPIVSDPGRRREAGWNPRFKAAAISHLALTTGRPIILSDMKIDYDNRDSAETGSYWNGEMPPVSAILGHKTVNLVFSELIDINEDKQRTEEYERSLENGDKRAQIKLLREVERELKEVFDSLSRVV